MRKFAVAVFILTSIRLWGQGSSEAQRPVTTIHVDVRSVVVDVVVTDKNGLPVQNLPKDSFKLFEDDTTQQLTHFEEHLLKKTPSAHQAGLNQVSLPTDTFSNAPLLGSDVVNVLLIDSMNTPMADQMYVHKQMIKYLGSIRPGTQIGIFALSNQLSMVQGITTDTSILKAALSSKSGNIVSSSLLPTPEQTAANRDAVAETASSGTVESSSQAAANALQQFQNTQTEFSSYERLVNTLDAFQQIAHYLAGMPGLGFIQNFLLDRSLHQKM